MASSQPPLKVIDSDPVIGLLTCSRPGMPDPFSCASSFCPEGSAQSSGREEKELYADVSGGLHAKQSPCPPASKSGASHARSSGVSRGQHQDSARLLSSRQPTSSALSDSTSTTITTLAWLEGGRGTSRNVCLQICVKEDMAVVSARLTLGLGAKGLPLSRCRRTRTLHSVSCRFSGPSQLQGRSAEQPNIWSDISKERPHFSGFLSCQ